MTSVLIDGLIYRIQRFGGISRYFTENLIRLGNDDKIKIILHVPSYYQASLPKTDYIFHIKDFNARPKRIFEPIMQSISKQRIKLYNPTIFHSTYYSAPYWSGLKNVVTVHDFIHEKYEAFLGTDHYTVSKKNIIENADAIIAVSNNTKKDILTYTEAKEEKISVIYHGVSNLFLNNKPLPSEIDDFRRFNKIEQPFWLYVGNRGKYKNFGTLLRAFVRYASANDDLLVAVGGEPILESWEMDLLIKNNLEKRLRLFHFFNDNKLRITYAAAQALIFPSLEEGFGIPLLEAMACGTPIIASDIAVFREIAGDAAYYFNPHDEIELYEAMFKVKSSNLIKNELVNNGYKRVSMFSWDAAAKKLKEIYLNI